MQKGNKYSDDRLIQDLCKEGGEDKDAFERLFHRYYPMVLNFVKGIVKNYVVAEDIAQNTFVKLWLILRTVQQEGYIHQLCMWRCVRYNSVSTFKEKSYI